MAFEQSGFTSFPVDGAPRTFRFSVSVANEKLVVWIEDSVTKEQWCVRRIVDCLSPSSEDDQPTRSLSRPGSDRSRILCVGFTLLAKAFTTALEYSVTLDVVPLDPLELLQARVRDLELAVGNLVIENGSLRRAVSWLSRDNPTLKADVAAHYTVQQPARPVIRPAKGVAFTHKRSTLAKPTWSKMLKRLEMRSVSEVDEVNLHKVCGQVIQLVKPTVHFSTGINMWTVRSEKPF